MSAIGERKRALGAMGTVFGQLNSRLSEVPDGSEEESLVGDGLDDLFTQLGENDTALGIEYECRKVGWGVRWKGDSARRTYEFWRM